MKFMPWRPISEGAHLALSLERVTALTGAEVQRIGLSATQRPIETIAKFLVGNRNPSSVDGHTSYQDVSHQPSAIGSAPCTVIDVGHRRDMDLAVEVPKDELGAVATNAIWSDIYDRVAALVEAHRSHPGVCEYATAG
jgi:ATP-dependent Lhr-like helicase